MPHQATFLFLQLRYHGRRIAKRIERVEKSQDLFSEGIICHVPSPFRAGPVLLRVMARSSNRVRSRGDQAACPLPVILRFCRTIEKAGFFAGLDARRSFFDFMLHRLSPERQVGRGYDKGTMRTDAGAATSGSTTSLSDTLKADGSEEGCFWSPGRSASGEPYKGFIVQVNTSGTWHTAGVGRIVMNSRTGSARRLSRRESKSLFPALRSSSPRALGSNSQADRTTLVPRHDWT